MAKDNSFDIVSEVEMQEIDNAVNQTRKEIAQRYDFKGSKAVINWENESIKIIADNEYQLRSVIDILQTKAVRRGIALRAFQYGKPSEAAGGAVRQEITVQRGISKEKGKDIIAAVKLLKRKVQAQMMEDRVRVTGKNRDDLQTVIQSLQEKDLGIELQFINYRTY